MKMMNLHLLKKTVGFAGALLVACGLIMAVAVAQNHYISDENRAYDAKVADFNFKLRKMLPFKMEDENMVVTDLYIRDEILYGHIMIDDVAYQGKAEDFFKSSILSSSEETKRDCQLFFLIQQHLPGLEYVEIDYTFKGQTRNYIFQCAPKIS
ncbi:MAG: Hypothetical protein BHV28_03590 [Candidatus Tokpelaia hoelldobleri]|uniref:Lipoprotein n=1 Tax=Candidatus Tokpelaia hoelldobleri TaxID=1902579 RepID=A0A1U9JT79_9HYPH|nr:MAG: Hypothetical protein BHV28_03590 [Candidatus Tokpelaia hoelldoblerii]